MLPRYYYRMGAMDPLFGVGHDLCGRRHLSGRVRAPFSSNYIIVVILRAANEYTHCSGK